MGGDGEGGKRFGVEVGEGTEAEKRRQVVGHEMVGGRNGGVWRMGAVRLD